LIKLYNKNGNLARQFFAFFLFEQATNFRYCSDKIYRGTAEVLSHTSTAKGGSKV
jgi:hypothetical protein